MDRSDLVNSNSGDLLKIGSGEEHYWAFIPNPLPPEIKISKDLWNLSSEAAMRLGELSGLGRDMPNPHILIRPFLHSEAISSSKIEGTQAEITDLYAFRAEQKPLPGFEAPRMIEDVVEVSNYIQSMDYGLERLETLPVSKRFIKELHARLMKGVRGDQLAPGEFRKSQNWIGPAGCTLNAAKFVPPPPDLLEEILDDFEAYLHLHEDHPPLIRLALIHYQFESIHPFLDGNGRIGRLLIPLLMVHWKLLKSPLLYLSAYFERNRDEYYSLLYNVSMRGEWKSWLKFFLKGIVAQSIDACERAKQLSDLQLRWREFLSERYSSTNVLRLVDLLFEWPILTTPMAKKQLNSSYRGAQLCIEKMLECDILSVWREGSPKSFVANEILRIMMEGN